jgi:hypothetical protein
MAYKVNTCTGPEDSRGRSCQILWQSPHEDSKVISSKPQPLLPPPPPHKKYSWYSFLLGHAVVQLVEALRYKSEGRGFDSRWCN